MKFEPLDRLYNPNYGFSNSMRRQIINEANLTTVKKAAAEHRVSTAAVYGWRKRVQAYERGYEDARAGF